MALCRLIEIESRVLLKIVKVIERMDEEEIGKCAKLQRFYITRRTPSNIE